MKKILLSVIACLPFISIAQTFDTTAVVQIPDYGPEVHDSLIVSGLPNTIDSTFGLAGMCFDITHTYDSDLLIRLKSPNGNSIFIANQVGGADDNFTGTCLAENGANGFLANGIAPFTGVYIPLESLNQLNNGQNPNGIWVLTIQDVAAVDSGNVHNFSLSFSSMPPPNPPPPPALCSGCSCPGGNTPCDLLPDMTCAALSISKDINPVTHYSAFEIPGNLNFDNSTPNIGNGPLEIKGVDSCYCDTVLVPCSTNICPNGNPVKQIIHQVIYQKPNASDTLTSYERSAGYESYHPTHGHIHVDHWADFTLRTSTSNPDATTWPIVGVGTKQSFCLINLGDCDGEYGYCVDTAGNTLHLADIPNAGFGFVTGCGIQQGIYVGSLDIYVAGLNTGIDLTNVCNGDYYIVSITDPENNMLETNELNNWAAVPVTLYQQASSPSASHTVQMLNSVTVKDSATQLNSASMYVWYFGDGSSPVWNTNPVSHTYTSSGTYYQTLTVNSPCGIFSKTDTITITITGVNSISKNNIYINATPNPARGIINIDYSLAKNNDITIELYDLSGKRIATILDKPEEAGMHTIKFDGKAATVSSGIYFLRLSSEGNSYSQKIEITD
jgi:hypothetical protein